MSPARGIVLDANILVRLVLGSTVRELVLGHVGEVVFFAPRDCFDDARRYLPDLLAKRGTDPKPALEVLDRFESVIRGVRSGPRIRTSSGPASLLGPLTGWLCTWEGRLATERRSATAEFSWMHD